MAVRSIRTAGKVTAVKLCLMALIFVIAQGAEARASEDAAARSLSPEQGQALADFASLTGPDVSPKPDCSHLMHLVYSRAGLNYTYAGSRQLYRGTPDFVRVKTPRAGDLVVWLGHVGIVLSPRDKTFLSSVRSGIITESWTNDYWLARGRPRFFRYIVGPRADLTMLASLTSQSEPGAAEEEIPRTISAAEDALPASRSEEQRRPSSIATIQQRSKPEKRDVAKAFHRGSMDAASSLLEGQPLGPNSLVSVVERVEVKQLRIRRDAGTLRLKLTETLVLEHGKTKPGSVVERELTLDQRDGVWVISDPDQRVYLLREQAEAVLEKQLRLKLQTSTARSDKRGLVAALNYLYDHESGAATAEARQR